MLKISPDIEVEERLAIAARQCSKAYLEINHVPDESFEKCPDWLFLNVV